MMKFILILLIFIQLVKFKICFKEEKDNLIINKNCFNFNDFHISWNHSTQSFQLPITKNNTQLIEIEFNDSRDYLQISNFQIVFTPLLQIDSTSAINQNCQYQFQLISITNDSNSKLFNRIIDQWSVIATTYPQYISSGLNKNSSCQTSEIDPQSCTLKLGELIGFINCKSTCNSSYQIINTFVSPLTKLVNKFTIKGKQKLIVLLKTINCSSSNNSQLYMTNINIDYSIDNICFNCY